MTHRLHNAVYAAFEEVKNAEKVTKAKLRELSRDLLVYVPESDDIDIVNRLIGVLTPVNRRVSILYFAHFLPWEQEKDADGNFLRFGKRMKGEKKLKRKQEAITAWLADDANDIWTWSDDNVEVKKKDFMATVSKAIEKALKGDEKSDTPPLTQDQLMAAIFQGGADVTAMLAACETKVAEMEQAEQDMSDDADEEATDDAGAYAAAA